MCGIVGITKPSRKVIEQLTTILKHRGPDGQAKYSDREVSLGHTRLAIQDLREKANQPLFYSHKNTEYVIVFNGEIYNFKELRKTLEKKKYTFSTESDTEVLAAAFDCWGPKCLEKCNGMFAFCIYNKTKKTLFLARDRFGIKPLYYALQSKQGFVFASEIKAITPLVENTINREELSRFFHQRFTTAPHTLFKNIAKLEQGHFLTYDLITKKVTKKQWYALPTQQQTISFKDAAKQLDFLLERAVSYRMIADVPVGVFLSGGLDSSLICSYAKPTNTFSIGFETTNELSYAQLVSQHIGSNHHEFATTQKELLSHIDKVVYHMDEPIGDPAFIPLFYLAKQVSKYNKVVLSGDGADEIGAGYDRYKFLHYGPHISFLGHKSKNQIIAKLKKIHGVSESQAYHLASNTFEEIGPLGLPKAELPYHNPTNSTIQNALYNDIQGVLVEDFFMKGDKMCSAFGVEQRVPFMDHNVVEFMMSIPAHYKLRWWNEKRLFKHVAKKKVPRKIIHRPKHGFNVPIDFWLKTSLGVELTKLLKKHTHSFYSKDVAHRLLEQLQQSNQGFKSNFILAQKLWLIYVFEKWLQKN